jgi:hypothetical protein
MMKKSVWLALAAACVLTACMGDESETASATEPPVTPTPTPPTNRVPVITGTPATSVQAGQAYSFTPSATDADNDPLGYTITGRPAWASFNLQTGALTGTPQDADVGQSGDISITVSDGKSSAVLGPFRITVTARSTTPPPPSNTPPTISGVPPASVVAGTAYNFQPTAADANGDTLSFVITNRPVWATFSTTTGRLSGTPSTAQVATYSNITISVSDGQASTALPTFLIQVQAPANRPPTISGTPATTATVGTAYAFQPSASDPDGNTLTYAIQNRPVWAAFNTSTGRLSGTPAAANVGTFANIVISVSDGNGGSAALPAFTLTVNAAPNRPPTISGTPSTSVTVGTAYTFTPTGNDPDGDTLTYAIANRPTWATFDTANGRLSGTPATANVGSTSNIVISVSDGKGGSASLAAFTLTVNAAANRPPTISGTPSTSVNVGATYSFTPTGSDPDGDTIAYGIANKPAWATFDTATGRLSGTPAAANVGTTSNIVISVADGKGGSATLPAFSITVNSVTTGSATLTWTAPTQNEDGTTLTNLAGYRIRYGTSSGALTQTIQVANPGLTTYVVDSLAQGTWYFAMTSYTSAGLESAQTNVVSKTIQ